MTNISQHERTPTGKEEWLTDPAIIKALGVFDLDPCAPIVRPWETAKSHWTIEIDGLIQPWWGRVWLNPPYGVKTRPFMRRMAEHNNGIALVYARTETRFFFESIWNHATALFFFQGRLQFYNVDGTPAPAQAGGPSVLVAYGIANANALKSCGLKGKYLTL
jgi:hypothetical protein